MGTARPKTIEELFERKKRRAYTLSVDRDTYKIVDQVSKVMGWSKPAVLAAFVSDAYDRFIQKARDSGIPVDRVVAPIVVPRKRGRPIRGVQEAQESAVENNEPPVPEEGKSGE
jgi:hypothetical protein